MSETPIHKLIDEQVEWREIPLEGARFTNGPDALYATHEGTLEIGAATLRVYQLNDGQRVFDADDIAAFFERAEDPSHG